MDPAGPSSTVDTTEGNSTASRDEHNTDAFVEAGEPSTPVEPPPAFLVRLMEDYARQLRRRTGAGRPEEEQQRGNNSTGANSSGGGTSNTLNTDVTGAGVGAGAATAGSTATSSIGTDVSPRAFSLYSGSSASSATSAPSSLSLPRATLDSNTTANTIANSNGKPLTTTTGSNTPLPNAPSSTLRRLEDVYSPPAVLAPEEELLPPENFAMVSSFVYRSSFPKRKNFPFLRSLGLKSVL